ncbi:MAG: precorrin-2 C(20)-methyltransferase [Rhodospirillales bacterium]
MSGILYGLGIGPGDPDLITLKAKEILAHVPVIAYPAPEGGDSLVRAIADPHVPTGCTEIAISTPMAIERFPAQEVYDRYAAIIAGHLGDRRDVAVLCEGDPFFYGSFMYLFERLAPRFPAIVVPGVSSLAAVTAAAATPLVSRNEVLSVLPAPLPEAELEARLARAEAAAIMKVGRHAGKVRRVLERLGLLDCATYVERASMANERILPLREAPDSAPYFSMILVRRPRPPLVQRAALPEGAALVALSAGGLALARRLQAVLPSSAVHGLASRADGADQTFTEAITHLRALFAGGVPIVGICAAGILVRATAPLLADKRAEPPVVAVAEDGSVAVPLLGGHHGANRLARAIAGVTAGVAAITTAGDVRLGFGLDEPPPGWRIKNPAAAKAVTAALLAGRPVALQADAGDAAWLAGSGAAFSDEAALRIVVTERGTAAADAAPDGDLVLHPPVLALGVGCERDCPPGELLALARETLAAHGLAEEAVACVVSLDLKADEPAVHALAEALAVPARFFSAAELEAQAPRLANPSDVVFREVGCHGVAEGRRSPPPGLPERWWSARREACAPPAPSPALPATSMPRPSAGRAAASPSSASAPAPPAGAPASCCARWTRRPTSSATASTST